MQEKQKKTDAFCIGNRRYSRTNTLVIAEIGTAHNGSRQKALELIHAAAEAGADCAKFQMVFAGEILHPLTGFVDLPGGRIPLYQRFRELELPPEFFAEMKESCEARGMLFLCTPFGEKSAAILRSLHPQAVKIASPELNHFPLIRACAGFGVPVILSTGVAKMQDIRRALAEIPDAAETLLLQCLTAYPAPENEYNIRSLAFLRKKTGRPCGVSDHSLDPYLVPGTACALGSCAVEKHICLSKTGGGLDDPVALDPEQFRRMTQALRRWEKQTPDQVLSELESRYGRAQVRAVLGRSRKTLAPSERRNYGYTNRSIHYMRDMKKGEIPGPDGAAVLRTEKTLTPGISPQYFSAVQCTPLARDVQNGDGARFRDFGGKRKLR